MRVYGIPGMTVVPDMWAHSGRIRVPARGGCVLDYVPTRERGYQMQGGEMALLWMRFRLEEIADA